MARTKAPKGTPTSLNLGVLRNHLAGGCDAQTGATAVSFPNRLHATSAPHIQRCLNAGLLTATRTTLTLTDAGRRVLGIAL